MDRRTLTPRGFELTVLLIYYVLSGFSILFTKMDRIMYSIALTLMITSKNHVQFRIAHLLLSLHTGDELALNFVDTFLVQLFSKMYIYASVMFWNLATK